VIAADGALCDITRRLAAGAPPVRCLLNPNDDPHRLQLTPRQSQELRSATLVLINGYGLTPALDRLPAAVRVAELAVPDSPALTADGNGDEHRHHTPHEHAGRDPHVWNDPRQAAAQVRLVSEQLQRLTPGQAAAIQARAERMESALTELHRWNQRQFATIPGRPTLASGHRAFASLARAYNLQELALLDADSDSTSLRPRRLADVIQQLRTRRVPSLFSEQLPAPKALDRISALSGVPIAPRPLLADNGGDNLMATLTDNTCLIVDRLGGRCDHRGEARLQQQWSAIR
jgi:zinc/manganese transport system substrate-binding protein